MSGSFTRSVGVVLAQKFQRSQINRASRGRVRGGYSTRSTGFSVEDQESGRVRVDYWHRTLNSAELFKMLGEMAWELEEAGFTIDRRPDDEFPGRGFTVAPLSSENT